MNISLPVHIEQELRKCAAATGQDLEHFVLQAVEEKMAELRELQLPLPEDQECFERKLQKIIELHPKTGTRIDDSRESIYADRGL